MNDQMNIRSDVKLIIRVMPEMNDYVLNVPITVSGSNIIQKLIDVEKDISKFDDSGNLIAYQLLKKGEDHFLNENKAIAHFHPTDDDILLMIPKVIAG